MATTAGMNEATRRRRKHLATRYLSFGLTASAATRKHTPMFAKLGATYIVNLTRHTVCS